MQGTFNQYTLMAELDKKHSHSTFLACPTNRGHGEPERQVILTVFSASLFRFPYEREKLLEKAQCLKEFQHPHLLPILDMGIEEDQPFVVREYLSNDSLRTRLRKISPNCLELRDALGIVLQVGEALTYAHEHNILHGNLKPENILFGTDEQIFLVDFSLASGKDAIIRDQTSQEYAFCYMAPEQFAGTSDARSDQYALGCLTYELITGYVPFAAQGLATMMGQSNYSLPAPLSKSVANLPPSLESAVLRTLARDPDMRFFDFSLFLEVIRSVLSPPPAFPLLRSIYSRKNRTISHPMPQKKAKVISSSISEYIAVQSSRTSGTFSIPENYMTEYADNRLKHDRSSAVMLETMPQSSLTSEQAAIGLPVTEEEIDDLVLKDPFEEDMSESLEFTPIIRSFYRRSLLGSGGVSSVSTGSIDLARPRILKTLRNRKSILGMALILSIVVVLFAYAVWPFAMTQLNPSSRSAQAMIHGLLPQIPVQFGNTANSQGSMQNSNALTAQGANSNPQTQSSSQTSDKGVVSSPSSASSSAPSLTSSSPSTSSSTASPTPAPTTPPQPINTINMTIYFSGWTDNSPPGGGIAYPQKHTTAGGTGTYADPITFAASKSALSPGTIIYVQNLKKYFIMEDDCGACDSAWNNNHTYEISLWTGGDANTSPSAQQSCESSLTPSSPQSVEVQPPSTNIVDTTPLFTDSDGCIHL